MHKPNKTLIPSPTRPSRRGSLPELGELKTLIDQARALRLELTRLKAFEPIADSARAGAEALSQAGLALEKNRRAPGECQEPQTLPPSKASHPNSNSSRPRKGAPMKRMTLPELMRALKNALPPDLAAKVIMGPEINLPGMPGFAPAKINADDPDFVVFLKWRQWRETEQGKSYQPKGLPLPKRVLIALLRRGRSVQEMEAKGWSPMAISELNKGSVTNQTCLELMNEEDRKACIEGEEREEERRLRDELDGVATSERGEPSPAPGLPDPSPPAAPKEKRTRAKRRNPLINNPPVPYEEHEARMRATEQELANRTPEELAAQRAAELKEAEERKERRAASQAREKARIEKLPPEQQASLAADKARAKRMMAEARARTRQIRRPSRPAGEADDPDD